MRAAALAKPAVRAPRLAYILDDDPGMTGLVYRMLVSRGCRATGFQQASPFLTATNSEPPDLVVLDLSLAETDGIEVMRRLRAASYAGRLLLISGKDRQVLSEVFKLGLSYGFAMLPFLQKPFTLVQFNEAVSAVPQYSPKTGPSNEARQSVSLMQALENRWLELHYQPKIDLKTLTMCGAEALVRISHPELGILPPDTFLPPPSDPLHIQLFKAVVRRAVEDWCKMAEMGSHVRLSVNAPPSILMAGDLMSFMRKTLPRHSGFPGLVVEVTEDEIIRDPQTAWELATQLKLYNIALSVDDFGKGAASIGRLRELQCTELKLDRGFVANCASDPTNRAVCEATVLIGHGMGMSICAEGVEAPADLLALRSMGFDTAQGYLFARPMPFLEFTKSLEKKAAPEAAPPVASERAACA